MSVDAVSAALRWVQHCSKRAKPKLHRIHAWRGAAVTTNEKHFCSLEKPYNMFHHVRPKALE